MSLMRPSEERLPLGPDRYLTSNLWCGRLTYSEYVKAFVLGCVLAGSQVAVAEPLTIAVAGDAPGIEAALAPYAPRIVTSDAPGSLEAARTIAKRERAHLVVWFTARTVVVYDAASDRVVERVMHADWQLGGAGAIEAARAVRVIVRTHRLGRARPLARLPRIPPPAVVLPAPAPVALDRRLGSHATVTVGAGIGVDPDGELQLAGMAIWRPEQLGVALLAEDSRTLLSADAFRGDVTTRAIALCGRLPVATGRFRSALLGGVTAQLNKLDGELMGVAVDDLRLDVALRVGASAGFELADRVELGLAMHGDTMLRRARYVAASGEVGEARRFQAAGLITLGVEIW